LIIEVLLMMNDPLITSIDYEIKRILNNRYVGVIHSHIEETFEPEPGPAIDEIDIPMYLKKVLKENGIDRLYAFQWKAFEKIIDDKNVVITAGTGTGKTEAFLIPILAKIAQKSYRKPSATLIYPTKALARDQLKRIDKYIGYGYYTASVYDGDTPKKMREKISQNPPDLIITNPDMINLGLVYSSAIRSFVENTRYIVFDELHEYEGVLGTHVKYIIERIKRMREGDKPVFIGSSATIGNPKEFAEKLFGEEVEVVEGPSRRKGVAIHSMVSTGGLNRWSVSAALAYLLGRDGYRFLVFTDSQQMAELVARIIKKYGLDVYVHRAGLPANLRRMVESKLRDGLIDGVVATPTLELGLDIGYLDAVVLTAPPPSYAKYLQRAGRAGRRGRRGYVFMILSDDPIDAYFERNPLRYYEQEIPPSTLEPMNEEVLKIHLVALLLEKYRLHIREIPREWFRVLDNLIYEKLAFRLGNYIYPNTRYARLFFNKYSNIRGAGPQVTIVDRDNDEVIGYRELPQALLDLHPNAIYYSFGTPYRSISIDIVEKKALVERIPGETYAYTRPLYTVDLLDFNEIASRKTLRGIPLTYAYVKLSISVEGYVLRDIGSDQGGLRYWFEEPITYSYDTKALLVKYMERSGWDLNSNAEAFHAIEHTIISAARPVCGASLGDMGGFSYPSGDIVIYDSAPGGSGLARLLYERYEKAEELAYEIMAKCDCIDGCPRCIYSPYCGNNNQTLSRRKALEILSEVLAEKQHVEQEPASHRYGKPIV